MSENAKSAIPEYDSSPNSVTLFLKTHKGSVKSEEKEEFVEELNVSLIKKRTNNFLRRFRFESFKQSTESKSRE